MGRDHLIAYLELLQTMGVNHVAFNLRFGSRPVPVVLDELQRHVLPLFPPQTPANPAAWTYLTPDPSTTAYPSVPASIRPAS